MRTIRPRGMAAALATATLCGLASLAGCATHVQNTANYAAPTGYPAVITARPRIVLVYPFSLDPAIVQLDPSMLAHLEGDSGSSDPGLQRAETAQDVTATITETLVAAFNKMGLPSRAAAPGEPPPPGAVVVQGQILKVTAGNAARRTLIGFGAGKSEVVAQVGVLRALPSGQLQPLESYRGDSSSGRTPGLGLGAASAAAGHIGMAVAGSAAGTIARHRTGLEREAANLGKQVASDIGQFFTAEGWIEAK